MTRSIATIVLMIACSSATAGESTVMDSLRLRKSTPKDLKAVFRDKARQTKQEGELESWNFEQGLIQGIADYRKGKLDQLLIYLPYDSAELEALGGVEQLMRRSGPTVFVNREKKGITLTLKTAARVRDETGQTMLISSPPPPKNTSIELKGFRRGWTEATTLEPGRYFVETRQKWLPERFGNRNHFVVWMHSDSGRNLVANDHGHTVESSYVTLTKKTSVVFLVEKCAGAWTIDVRRVSSVR